MSASPVSVAPEAPDRVLSTLNQDGSRRWLRPRPSPGRFLLRRRVVAWTLIVLFTAIPYVRINGKPMILLDIAHREFTVLGVTFLPTDTVMLMLLLVGIFLGIFLLTALFGRVWCGWACPQTVYMEFVYRPIERLIEGGRTAQAALDARRLTGRRLLKHAVFLGVSMSLAHTFLAYFVGVDQLARWITGSPLDHPIAFVVMAATTVLMLLDFGWFREQVCLVACPYGRFQSVLLDRHSLIVAFDARRGEPRATFRTRKHGTGRTWGDCIDCRLCVTTCPTGIDIRDGLQMECIACTQCIDACDGVMDKIGVPRGLIRYGSRAELAGEPRRMLRPRLVFYPLLVAIVWGLLAVALVRREPADVTVLRGVGSPFTLLPSGEVSNQVRVKIVNRSDGPRRYFIELADREKLRLVAPDNPVAVRPGKTVTTVLFVTAPRTSLPAGQRDILLRITDDAGYTTTAPYRLLGPTGAAAQAPSGGSS